jgi:hypothetical protein
LLEELRKADAEKIPVRIDAKTTILVPKGTDKQAVIAAYKAREKKIADSIKIRWR